MPTLATYLLLGSPGAPTSSRLDGVEEDLRTFRTFLTTRVGIQWLPQGCLAVVDAIDPMSVLSRYFSVHGPQLYVLCYSGHGSSGLEVSTERTAGGGGGGGGAVGVAGTRMEGTDGGAVGPTSPRGAWVIGRHRITLADVLQVWADTAPRRRGRADSGGGGGGFGDDDRSSRSDNDNSSGDDSSCGGGSDSGGSKRNNSGSGSSSGSGSGSDSGRYGVTGTGGTGNDDPGSPARLVIVSDSCHSGAWVSALRAAASGRGRTPLPARLRAAARTVAVQASCQTDQVTMETGLIVGRRGSSFLRMWRGLPQHGRTVRLLPVTTGFCV